ncbi:gliding motility-associated C-terminal domain-containing protein [Flavobacteriaceae bacterium D16]|nr:gliding motility-associated C-terminal domain-containing protein [Flavobacteriaceae bacterium D16]
MKPQLRTSLTSIFTAFAMLAYLATTAQSLNAPVAAPNQTPPAGSSPWSQACASDSFNDYWVNFTWGPPLVNGDNEFILELSDANGDFGSPVELARDNSKNTTFDFYFQFALPADTRGEGYRMRVRSTSPAVTSPVSVPYPMYYISVNTGLTIRPQGQADFGDGTAQVCDGNSITLEVYDLPNADTYQYNWYRSGTPLADKGSSITVSQSGMYNVEIDYGSCSGSGNTLSNLIDVTVGSSLGIAINPPAKTSLCSGETVDLVANITGMGLTYTWFKDGSPVTSPVVDDDTYTVDASIAGFEGDYEVEVFGAGACVERSAAVTITNAGNFTVTRDNPAELVVLPGFTETLSVSTDATSPTYQWYKDGAAVPGATSNTLVVGETDSGAYYARVSLSGGACASTSIDSDPTNVAVPTSIDATIAYASTYAECVNTDIVLEISTLTADISGGGTIDVTSQLVSSISAQWKKDGANVAGATSNSISLTNISENGNYDVDIAIGGYTDTSNALSVRLLVNELLTINSTSTTSCGPSEIITLSTPTDLNGETFSWYRDGVDLGNSSETLDTTEPGTYQLVIDRNGCPLGSNELVISPLNPDLITLDSPDNVVFPEGTSRTVTASGADSYRWLDQNNIEMSSSSSMTFTDEGSFLLIAMIGNCQVSRAITVEYQDTFKVPNVVSANGDGINDLWVIPNSFSNKTEVNVIIYNDRGEEVFNVFNYQNNWPESSTSFPRQNMVFYYKIRNNSEVLKQGTITVIR